jgi:hypothetical protein
MKRLIVLWIRVILPLLGVVVACTAACPKLADLSQKGAACGCVSSCTTEEEKCNNAGGGSDGCSGKVVRASTVTDSTDKDEQSKEGSGTPCTGGTNCDLLKNQECTSCP